MISSKEHIENIIYNVNLKLADNAKGFTNKLLYGFPHEDNPINNLKLRLYTDVLYGIFHGNSCLQKCKQELLWDKLSKLLGQDCYSLGNYSYTSGEVFKMNRKDIVIDDCNRDSWILSNPRQVNRERWQKVLYEVLEPISFSLEEHTIACDITYNLFSQKVPIEVLLGIFVSNIACAISQGLSQEKLVILDTPRFTSNPVVCTVDSEITLKDLSCKINSELKNILRDCKTNYSVNNDFIDCKHYYELFNTKYCDKLDYTTYSKLIDCNISPTLINLIFDAGLNIYIDSNGNPIFFTGDCEYNLNDPNFLGAINNELLQLMLKYPLDEVLKPYLDNPEEFILNLGSDYDLDQELLNLLLGNGN